MYINGLFVAYLILCNYSAENKTKKHKKNEKNNKYH